MIFFLTTNVICAICLFGISLSFMYLIDLVQWCLPFLIVYTCIAICVGIVQHFQIHLIPFFACLSISLCLCLSMSPFLYVSISLCLYLSSIYLSIYLSISLSIYLSLCFYRCLCPISCCVSFIYFIPYPPLSRIIYCFFSCKFSYMFLPLVILVLPLIVGLKLRSQC